MKLAFVKPISLLFSCAAVAICGGLPANAETVASVPQSDEQVITEVEQVVTEVEQSASVLAQNEATAQSEQPIPTVLETLTIESTTNPSTSTTSESMTSGSSATTTEPANRSEAAPVPGTTSQSSAMLEPSPTAPSESNTAPSTGSSNILAQDIEPGRGTRSGSSYVGIGGNIGLGDGDTQIGEGAFAIISKVGLTSSISVRPSVLISDGVTILLPVTYDFFFGEGPTDEFGFAAAPYLGAGAAISTEDDLDVDLLLTAGIDVPLGSQFTATAAVNASVTGNTAIGLLIGVGYNFSGF
jgi:hypothetical protein